MEKECSGSSSGSDSTTEILSGNESDEEPDWGPALAAELVDPSSPMFNARLVLSLNSEKDPVDPSAPRYLNLATYAKAVQNPAQEANTSLQLKKVSSKPPSTSSAASAQQKSVTSSTPATSQQYPIPGRRFLPHQMPVYNPRVEAADTVKVMETVEGPLGALRVAMEGKTRIKVWTRRDNGVRGYLIGFLEAFDKHWNLAMRDVDEVFCRRRKTKSMLELDDRQDSCQRRSTEHHVPDPSSPAKCRTSSLSPQRHNRSRPLKTIPSDISSPTKRSKRIAARSRSKSKREVLQPNCSEDLVNWCRRKMDNLFLNKKSKSVNNESLASPKLNSKSFEKKHGITLFSYPQRDANGFVVIGVTQKLEIVKRHAGQLFVMGNDVVMVETMR